jgi:hypothetical protein
MFVVMNLSLLHWHIIHADILETTFDTGNLDIKILKTRHFPFKIPTFFISKDDMIFESTSNSGNTVLSSTLNFFFDLELYKSRGPKFSASLYFLTINYHLQDGGSQIHQTSMDDEQQQKLTWKRDFHLFSKAFTSNGMSDSMMPIQVLQVLVDEQFPLIFSLSLCRHHHSKY